MNPNLDPDTLPVVMRSVQRWLVWRLEPNLNVSQTIRSQAFDEMWN